MMIKEWKHKIFNLTYNCFEDTALEIFRFQAAQNPVYKAFVQTLGIQPDSVQGLEQIPFLPVRFFKSHKVKTTDYEPVIIFESSGTSGSATSKHYIKDLSLYETSFLSGFEKFYGQINTWCIIGLLPSYLERGNSSLVYMTDVLIRKSGHPLSGFYLHDFRKLSQVLNELEYVNQKTLLLGVTFALLDFAAACPLRLRNTIIMETGGMKGRRKEMIREEIHLILQKAFDVPHIHSEYGMTELLSQAYSQGGGIFQTPPWMKIILRDEEDPFFTKDKGSGIINVIDLANVYSCSFIATDDTGILHADGTFEVLGRVDGSDIRGCSLLTA